MRLLPLLLTALALSVGNLSISVVAQPVPGDCAYGTARDSLDVNQARAPIFNTGALFSDRTSGVLQGYRTTDAPDALQLYQTLLWLAGKVGDEARAAASYFGSPEFWPGPLGPGATPPEDCLAYDRIWTVSRQDVARYLATGEATDDLLDWPADLGAPVLDGDGVEGNYDLAGGDQPAIRGDQTAWWVMNDAGNTHPYTESAPLGVEVRVEAFAAEGTGTTPEALDPATFYRYAFTNRTDQPIDSVFVGWLMVPVFDFSFFGSDTTNGLVYTYATRNELPGYGTNPPSWGASVVDGPVGLPNGRDDDGDGEADEPGERLGTTTANLIFSGGAPWSSDPRTPTEFTRRMSGRWNNGFPIVEGGAGYPGADGGDVLQFAFPGDPTVPSFWSALKPYHDQSGVTIFVSRFFLATGPFRLGPGETQAVTFAVTYARGADRFSSIRRLRAYTDEVQFQYDLGALVPRQVSASEFGSGTEPPPEGELPEGIRLARPHPNPFAGPLALRYEVPAPTPLRLAVYDALGREVAVLFDGTAEPGTHEAVLDGEALAPGVYFVRLAVPGGHRTLAITRAPR